jgi:hypothetical protein
MNIDTATALAVLVSLQAFQLAQTAVLGRVVRRSLRPPPPPATRGTPVVFEPDESPPDRADPTPSERIRTRKDTP